VAGIPEQGGRRARPEEDAMTDYGTLEEVLAQDPVPLLDPAAGSPDEALVGIYDADPHLYEDEDSASNLSDMENFSGHERPAITSRLDRVALSDELPPRPRATAFWLPDSKRRPTRPAPLGVPPLQRCGQSSRQGNRALSRRGWDRDALDRRLWRGQSHTGHSHSPSIISAFQASGFFTHRIESSAVVTGASPAASASSSALSLVPLTRLEVPFA
jgi:hypothetical protein